MRVGHVLGERPETTKQLKFQCASEDARLGFAAAGPVPRASANAQRTFVWYAVRTEAVRTISGSNLPIQRERTPAQLEDVLLTASF